MNRIDIVSGIAFVSGLALYAISSANLLALFITPVAIFSAYYTGRLTGKKETWEKVLNFCKERSLQIKEVVDGKLEIWKNNRTSAPLKISDFHIGFEYEELQMDGERYFNQGMIWVKKTYSFESPRLRKMEILLQEGKLRRPINIETHAYEN